MANKVIYEASFDLIIELKPIEEPQGIPIKQVAQIDCPSAEAPQIEMLNEKNIEAFANIALQMYLN